jgi:hypothetical protein
MAGTEKNICIGILISILIIMIIYIIVLFECYKNNTFIFTPYTPPKPPVEENPFNPTGEIKSLSPDEEDFKKCVVACGLSGGDACQCLDKSSKLELDQDMIF